MTGQALSWSKAVAAHRKSQQWQRRRKDGRWCYDWHGDLLFPLLPFGWRFPNHICNCLSVNPSCTDSSARFGVFMTRFTGGFPPDPDAPAPLLPPTAAGADAGPVLPIPAAAAPASSSPEDSIPVDRNPRFANPAATRQLNTTQH
nr:unnamed protein product [Digitaria exilis]